MIRHHLTTFQQKKEITFNIDEKKLVKTFIYLNKDEWIEYFTGFLFMQPNEQGKVDLKVPYLFECKQIRFSRHPHLAQIQASIQIPLELHTDQKGLYTLIHEDMIKTVQKPQDNLLYIKIVQQKRIQNEEGKIIAISFHSKTYCKALLQHLTLLVENNNESQQMTWTEENLWFLNSSMKQNLMYVDSVFILEERIAQFCNFFNKTDKRLYMPNERKNTQTAQYKYMQQFFEVVKNMFLRANDKILKTFIQDKFYFETILKCLSYNPFGTFYFNYLEEYNNMTIISNHISQELQSQDFLSKYELITRVKFLRDVAICTFTQIPTEAIFNQMLNQCYVKILERLSDIKSNHFFQKLHELAVKDPQKYICVFTEIWEIFKLIIEDIQTTTIKEKFYIEWIQAELFKQTLSTIARVVNDSERQIHDINPRFWQKWMESMNPMMSYQWTQTQKIILNHKNGLKQQNQANRDFMGSLIMILANCDSNTKVLILDFVRVQVQISQNRKHISAKYLSYLYDGFVKQSFQYCNNQEDIEGYLQFLQKIYVAQPVRTRHALVEGKIFQSLKPFMNNKFVFISLLKLLKAFIQIGDTDTFKYLSVCDFYDDIRKKYHQNQKLSNVINSLFLAIFKSLQSMTNPEGKKYLFKIFFEAKPQKNSKYDESELIDEECLQNSFKRKAPASGLQNEMDIQK